MTTRLSPKLPARRPDFAAGYTAITGTGVGPAAFETGIEFGIRRLAAGAVLEEVSTLESAFVLLAGGAGITTPESSGSATRENVFDDPPTCLHVCREVPVRIAAAGRGAEFAIVRTSNPARFPARFFRPGEINPEYRGAGLVQNACLRNVRLIFDRALRPESNLVLGEVVNYPGRWSSYPPHHHDQPEIYHYRFTAPEGYGHAEVGEEVLKVRHGDTILIPPGLDHAQVSAPGYGMYYLWMIRHLPGNPYQGFTFADEHKWALDAAQQGWRARDLPAGLA